MDKFAIPEVDLFSEEIAEKNPPATTLLDTKGCKFGLILNIISN